MATFSKLDENKDNTNQDLISNLPTDIIEIILKRLPLSTVTKMSVLSKCWRDYWLSHKYLLFNRDFWTEQNPIGHKFKCESVSQVNSIISNILLNHNGPVHKFYLMSIEISRNESFGITYNTSAWISYLSKIGVKKIIILSILWPLKTYIPSHIYACKDLVKLKLDNCNMAPPPSHFKGFVHLQSLKLANIIFQDHVFRQLVVNCPKLTKLSLHTLSIGENNDLAIIDMSSLKKVSLIGWFTSIAFENIQNLESLTITGLFGSISFDKMVHCNLRNISISLNIIWMTTMAMSKNIYSAIHRLAASCRLQQLHFAGELPKVLADGCPSKQLTMTFEHLQKLSLEDIELSNHDDYCFTISMIQRCPLIKDLDISVRWKREVIDAGKHNLEYDKNYKSKHLQRVNIHSISESNKHLELIEYILASSVVLENLFIYIPNINLPSEIKLLKDLLRIPRASRKAILELKRMYGEYKRH